MSTEIMAQGQTSADEIEIQAAQWIERRDFGGWSEDDERGLETWLDQSLHHRVAYDRLDLGWQSTSRLTALRNARPLHKQQSPSGQSQTTFRRIAAFAALSAVALGGWYVLSAPSQTTYATSIGGREIIRLTDGSQIELNTNTVVRIADRANRREVWLEKGEAYFQIVHDGRHPFVVNAGTGRIVDIGTRFSVRRDDDRLRVAVSEGSVEFNANSESRFHPVVLKPGEVALATSDNLSVSRENEASLTNDLSWRSGVLKFHHTRLADAAAEFNRYNHRQIEVTDPAAADLEIGGTFPTTDVEGFAEVSQDILHLRVTKDGQAIRISR